MVNCSAANAHTPGVVLPSQHEALLHRFVSTTQLGVDCSKYKAFPQSYAESVGLTPFGSFRFVDNGNMLQKVALTVNISSLCTTSSEPVTLSKRSMLDQFFKAKRAIKRAKLHSLWIKISNFCHL